MAQASPPQKECKGLDIVFLIDQSESMLTNDANGIRSNAVRTALDILGDNAMYFCPGVKHRIAVLGFGDEWNDAPDTRIYISSTTVISPSLEDIKAWFDYRTELKNTVPFIEDLGATDHLSALQAAAEIMDDWLASADDVGTPRKRAVVLVTDGAPCILDQGCVKGNDTFTYSPKLPAYMQQVEDFAASRLAWRGADNPASVYMWLIGFRSQSGSDFFDDKRIREPWERIAASHAGQVQILQPGEKEVMNADLTSIVATIMDPLLGSRLTRWNCTEPIWIDPYISDVTIIHVFRRGANPGLSLANVVVRIKTVVGGQVIAVIESGSVTAGSGRVDDYTRDGPNERYVFYRPMPGKYLVEVEGANACQHLDVRIGRSGVGLQVVEPKEGATLQEVDKPPYYDTTSPARFRVQLFQQGQGKQLDPLEEQPGFPLALTVRTHSPTTYATPVFYTYTLKLEDEAQAIYAATEPLNLQYPGDYTWHLTATTTNPRAVDPDPQYRNDTPVVVLTATGTFRILPMQRPFDFSIRSPVENEEYPLVNGISSAPLRVEVRVEDGSGNPLGAPIGLAAPGATPFRARWMDEQGRELATQAMKLSDQDVYVAEFPSGKANTLEYDPGAYQVIVELTGDYRREVFQPRRQRSDPRHFRMVLAREFKWDIVEPLSQTYSIHPQLGFFPPPQPVPLVVQVESLDGRLLVAGDVLKSADAVLFTGRLYPPGLATMYELQFRPSEKVGQFVAEWPAGLAMPGQYTLEVAPVRGANASAWIPNTMEPQSRLFSRQDTLLTQPWALTALIGAATALVLFAVLVWNVATRPVGVITFTDSGGTRAILHDEYLGRPFRGWRHTYSSRSSALRSLHLSRLKATKAKPDPEKGGRAIHLCLYDDEGGLLLDNILHSGESDYVGHGVDVKYE